MDYTMLRQFADSWGLVFLLLFFVGAIVFIFRPGARKQASDAAAIPLRDDEPLKGDADK